MVRISFTKQAIQDLREIKEYIALDSPLNAKRVLDKIIIEIQTLSSRPEKGRIIIRTYTENIRQILVYKYRIFYRQVNNVIQIISIYHGSRLIENNPGLQQFFEE